MSAGDRYLSRRERARRDHEEELRLHRATRAQQMEARKAAWARMLDSEAYCQAEQTEALAGRICAYCGRECAKKGLASHERACKQNPKNLHLYAGDEGAGRKR